MHPSFANRSNLDLLEENYRRWQEDPASLDPSWMAFFEGFELGDLNLRNGAAAMAATPTAELGDQPLQTRVDGLVYAYRTLGHTIARIDPLADKRPENPLLSLRELGFSEKDLDLVVSSKFFFDGRKLPLREMIALLESIYAESIGSEFQHIQNPRIRNWVRHRLESRPAKHDTSREAQIALEIAYGKTDHEIAGTMGVAFSTIRTHINHLYGKLGVRNRAALERLICA